MRLLTLIRHRIGVVLITLGILAMPDNCITEKFKKNYCEIGNQIKLNQSCGQSFIEQLFIK